MPLYGFQLTNIINIKISSMEYGRYHEMSDDNFILTYTPETPATRTMGFSQTNVNSGSMEQNVIKQ